MPVQLKSLLDAFKKRYGELIGDDVKMERAMAERRALAESRTSANVAVSPLLGNIEWDQDSPYYDMCPAVGKDHSLT